MRKTIILLSLGAILFTGCTSSGEPQYQEPQQKQPEQKPVEAFNPYRMERMPVYQEPNANKEQAFAEAFKTVAISTKSDNNYRRIGLDTPTNKEWFKQNTYFLWDRQISKGQYVREGLKRFPFNEYEFKYVADNLDSKGV